MTANGSPETRWPVFFASQTRISTGAPFVFAIFRIRTKRGLKFCTGPLQVRNGWAQVMESRHGVCSVSGSVVNSWSRQPAHPDDTNDACRILPYDTIRILDVTTRTPEPTSASAAEAPSVPAFMTELQDTVARGDRQSGMTDQGCQVSVIVPTYREAENLPSLIPRIAVALSGAAMQGEILVVDDNSPDHTEQACAQLAAKYPVRLIVRRAERGLSGAVIEGMRQAQGEVLVVVDADLSHPPEMIPDLVRAIEDGAEFAIGSRYVAGGGTDENWGLLRWLNSKAATLLARPLTTARDPMAGFFALNRTTFESAEHLNPIGYKIGLELMVKCGCRSVYGNPDLLRTSIPRHE